MTLKQIKQTAIAKGACDVLTLEMIDLAYEAGRLQGLEEGLDRAKKIVEELFDRKAATDG